MACPLALQIHVTPGRILNSGYSDLSQESPTMVTMPSPTKDLRKRG